MYCGQDGHRLTSNCGFSRHKVHGDTMNDGLDGCADVWALGKGEGS